jgi:hypothetical protein
MATKCKICNREFNQTDCLQWGRHAKCKACFALEMKQKNNAKKQAETLKRLAENPFDYSSDIKHLKQDFPIWDEWKLKNPNGDFKAYITAKTDFCQINEPVQKTNLAIDVSLPNLCYSIQSKISNYDKLSLKEKSHLGVCDVCSKFYKKYDVSNFAVSWSSNNLKNFYGSWQ